MSIRLLLPLFVALGSAYAADPVSLSGSATNSTNPKKVQTAPITISLNSDGECVLRVSAPLYGSGTCSFKSTENGEMKFSSVGPSGNIEWNGTCKTSTCSGTYEVSFPDYPDLPEAGTFFVALDSQPQDIKLKDVMRGTKFENEGKEYGVLVDRDVAYIYDSTWKYAGVRMLFDSENNVRVKIEDHPDGSLIIDGKTGKTLYEWHVDKSKNTGYFSRSEDGVTSYYDRNFEFTSWTSIESSGKKIFMYTSGDSTSLYDESLKPLNIWSSKSSNGRVFWVKKHDNGLLQYFDDKLQPTNWYAADVNGETRYAYANGKKVQVYDANFRPIKKRPGFWSTFAAGMAQGLSAYGQALQRQNAYDQANDNTTAYYPYNNTTQRINNFGYSTATDSRANTYNSTTQRIGNFDYTNTYGSNGYQANTTTQHIGNFDYTNGTTSNGFISGSSQRIGNFNYSTMTTQQGTWNGTSQQIGNFTYQTFTAPDGTMHTGTTQKIGDFIYTTVQ